MATMHTIRSTSRLSIEDWLTSHGFKPCARGWLNASGTQAYVTRDGGKWLAWYGEQGNMPMMYRLTRNGKTIATFRYDDIRTGSFGTPSGEARIREMVAEAVGGAVMVDCIRRGSVHTYTDGAITIRPRRHDGSQCRDRRGLTFFTLTPYLMAPVDVGTITEYSLTQKLSTPIRCF